MKLWAQDLLLLSSVPPISQNAVLLDEVRSLVVLVRGVGAVPVVFIGGETAQHEVAQVVLGDDP